jgi:hypothetical protein
VSYIKVEFLLPFKDNNGNKIKPDKYDITYKELDKRFRGFTVDFTPLLGSWIDDERKNYRENNFGIYVICKNNKANRTFWRRYKTTLKQRFEQKSTMMYYLRIYYI